VTESYRLVAQAERHSVGDNACWRLLDFGPIRVVDGADAVP